MVENQLQFDQRLRQLDRKYRAMSHGFTTRIRSDGLIVVQPERARFRVPIKPLLVFIIAVIAFKGFLIANLGPATYDDRVAKLRSGTIVEQAGAFIMQSDPASHYIAGQIGPILR